MVLDTETVEYVRGSVMAFAAGKNRSRSIGVHARRSALSSYLRETIVRDNLILPEMSRMTMRTRSLEGEEDRTEA